MSENQQALLTSEEDWLGAKSQILLIQLGEECFALDMSPIEGVFLYADACPVPKQPIFIQGFLAHRGVCIPVVNLHQLLGIKEREVSSTTRSLLLNHADIRLFLPVDAILGTRQIEESAKDDNQLAYQAEVVAVDGKSFPLLHLRTLLAAEQLESDL